MKTLIKYKLKSLFLIVCLSIPTLILGVEVCKVTSGCQIDEKGICIDCIEQEFEEETEEDRLERKIDVEKEQEKKDQFWQNLSLEFFGGYGNSYFTFTCQDNTSIDRPYINEVNYNGFSLRTRLRLPQEFLFQLQILEMV